MFMIEKEESLKTPELLLKFLDEHDVKYKDRQLTKNSKIRVIVVKNKELEKIARAKGQGVSYGKGQHKFYYINDDVIILYNYYSKNFKRLVFLWLIAIMLIIYFFNYGVPENINNLFVKKDDVKWILPSIITVFASLFMTGFLNRGDQNSWLRPHTDI